MFVRFTKYVFPAAIWVGRISPIETEADLTAAGNSQVLKILLVIITNHRY